MARQPPSQLVSFSPRNGVEPPSGHVMTSAPLSVVKTTMVLSATPSKFKLGRRQGVPAEKEAGRQYRRVHRLLGNARNTLRRVSGARNGSFASHCGRTATVMNYRSGSS
jgi:hypothetical protein